jgi:hypothetical protein
MMRSLCNAAVILLAALAGCRSALLTGRLHAWERLCLDALNGAGPAYVDAVETGANEQTASGMTDVELVEAIQAANQAVHISAGGYNVFTSRDSSGRLLAAFEVCYGLSDVYVFAGSPSGEVALIGMLPGPAAMGSQRVQWVGEAAYIEVKSTPPLAVRQTRVFAQHGDDWGIVESTGSPAFIGPPLRRPTGAYTDAEGHLNVTWRVYPGVTTRAAYEWRDGRYRRIPSADWWLIPAGVGAAALLIGGLAAYLIRDRRRGPSLLALLGVLLAGCAAPAPLQRTLTAMRDPAAWRYNRCLDSLSEHAADLDAAIAGEASRLEDLSPEGGGWEAVFIGAADTAGLQRPRPEAQLVESGAGTLAKVWWCGPDDATSYLYVIEPGGAATWVATSTDPYDVVRFHAVESGWAVVGELTLPGVEQPYEAVIAAITPGQTGWTFIMAPQEPLREILRGYTWQPAPAFETADGLDDLLVRFMVPYGARGLVYLWGLGLYVDVEPAETEGCC